MSERPHPAPAAGIAEVERYLAGLQDCLCAALESLDAGAAFGDDGWERAAGGGGRTRVLAAGRIFEQAGVGFSHVRGDALPAAASSRRPELAGASFQAMGVSVVVHPWNPYVPTSHMNVRFLSARTPRGGGAWWFGGGFDLTPFYPEHEDVVEWHRVAWACCAPFGEAVYPRFKRWCDEYFYLRHRGETRGVGGLFFDDLDEWGFEGSFAFVRAVGDAYLKAYLPIVERRMGRAYGAREREFQLFRRGRYVEFNLVYDRGTLFGLQTGGRVDSILMSLPPEVRWGYAWAPRPGTPEARLARYLVPREWL